MNDETGDNKGGRTPLGMRGGVGETTRVRQSFSHGRTKSVVVEKIKKRIVTPAPGAAPAAPAAAAAAPQRPAAPPAPGAVRPAATPAPIMRPAQPAAPTTGAVRPVAPTIVRPVAPPVAQAAAPPVAQAPRVAETVAAAQPASAPVSPPASSATTAEVPVTGDVAPAASAAAAPQPAAPVAELRATEAAVTPAQPVAPAVVAKQAVPAPTAELRQPAAPVARTAEPARSAAPTPPRPSAPPQRPAAPTGARHADAPRAPGVRAPEAPRGEPGRQDARPGAPRPQGRGAVHKALSAEEHARRLKALEMAKKNEESRRKQDAEDAKRRDEEGERRRREMAEISRREAEERIRREREEAEREERERVAAETARRAEEAARRARDTVRPGAAAPTAELRSVPRVIEPDGGDMDRHGKRGARGPGAAGPAEGAKKAAAPRARDDADRRRSGKLTIDQLTADGGRQRSLASFRRRQEREKRKLSGPGERERVVRDVVIPDAITVGELANRMAERGADVVKALMKMGVMATITQTIDADTAQILVEEFGHKFVRVSESDVENVIETAADDAGATAARAPVVTIMGHVDHGKTSLLDALRKTNVVAGEAGGITQHIGAYQVDTQRGGKITFLDTPGHAAFTSMRARGAAVTDIVVLVVAADDSVMPQTVEAISHAKAAKVPMIVAINKCDKGSANPDRVRQQLLQHEVMVEAMGGETLDVEVSAVTRKGLDQLVEAIALQSELLDLRANPDRPAEGAVIEAKLDVGRGPVATVLVQRGTLRPGDIFVVGEQWGKVRALVDDKGARVKEAGPSVPVEVLGLSGTPEAGDVLNVVESEAKAREIADYRARKAREKQAVAGARASLDQLLAQARSANVKELPVVVKADVQGSAEAIVQALEKIGNEEVRVRILHAGVGAVTESDVGLADASKAPIIGFNVRANAPARESANQKGVEIRYYSVIYNLVDDVKQAASGLLSAEIKETFIGYATIKQVFKISNVGKVAGCLVTEGVARRAAGVRLLRDNVVIHEGTLKTLKRFKDEVKEVQVGQECGMAFQNYEDIREGDVIEIFTTEEIERTL
jgi:translation initiation factor IF-2